MFLFVLLKQNLKLQCFGNNFKLWFDWYHVSSICVVETKIEASMFLATIVSFDLIDFMFLVVLFWNKNWSFNLFATISSFDLIDFMFLVIFLKQKLKLQFVCNNFKLWFDWFHVSSCVVKTKFKLSFCKQNFKLWLDGFVSGCCRDKRQAFCNDFKLWFFLFLVCCRDSSQAFGNNFKLFIWLILVSGLL